jgi:hypothetical protein
MSQDQNVLKSDLAFGILHIAITLKITLKKTSSSPTGGED